MEADDTQKTSYNADTAGLPMGAMPLAFAHNIREEQETFALRLGGVLDFLQTADTAHAEDIGVEEIEFQGQAINAHVMMVTGGEFGSNKLLLYCLEDGTITRMINTVSDRPGTLEYATPEEIAEAFGEDAIIFDSPEETNSEDAAE